VVVVCLGLVIVDDLGIVWGCKKNDGDEHSSYIFNKVMML
jgi:hypothetical protein